VTEGNDLETEAGSRIVLANKCYRGLIGKFKYNFLALCTKLRLYRTQLRLVLICGSESETLTNS
jgi:hypothetical protein